MASNGIKMTSVSQDAKLGKVLQPMAILFNIFYKEFRHPFTRQVSKQNFAISKVRKCNFLKRPCKCITIELRYFELRLANLSLKCRDLRTNVAVVGVEK